MPNLIFLIISLCLFAQPTLAKKQADPSIAAFANLDAENNRFLNDKKAQKFRHNYEKIAAKWEAFAERYPQSKKAATALIKAADLSEKVANITHFTRDYKKTAELLVLAAKKAQLQTERDTALERAAHIFEIQLDDISMALSTLAPYAKAKQLPKVKQLYALLRKKAPPPPVVAKAPAAKTPAPEATPALDKASNSTTTERIEKVELLNADGGMGLRLTTTGDLQIKHGVIPKSTDAPRRVYFDFSKSTLDNKVPLSFMIAKNGINQVRLGQFKDDVVRIVVEADVNTPFHVKADSNPIEIWFGQSAPAFAEGEDEEEAPAPTKMAEQNDAPLGLSLRKIVIDPGHGGNDPGAIGKGGLKEKDVTLAISKRLKAAIEKQMPGVKVFLTRDHDKYVSLSERTQMANELHADLFLSVHVNSSPNRKTQGIETYYLNISHDRYAVRLAARENAMSESEISNLEFILADLAMKSNVSDSVRLGQELQSSVFNHVQSGWSDVKDLGLKHALFSVLLGARMPAVLVETAFISNRDDEKRLRSDRYQDAIVAGLVKGIRRYSEQKQAMYTP